MRSVTRRKGLRRAREHPRGSLVRPVPWNPSFLRVDPQLPLPLPNPCRSLYRGRKRPPWLVSRYLDRCFRVTPAPASELHRPLFTVMFKRPFHPSVLVQVLGKYAFPPRCHPLKFRRIRTEPFRGLDLRLNVSFPIYFRDYEKVYEMGYRCFSEKQVIILAIFLENYFFIIA